MRNGLSWVRWWMDDPDLERAPGADGVRFSPGQAGLRQPSPELSMDPAVTPTVAILADRDEAAVALATLLRRRGVAQVVFADERALVRARLVHHPPSGSLNGKTMAPIPDAVYLPDGTVLDGNTDLIVSRLSTFAPALQATPARREYAEAEAFAFVLSWLAGLGDRTLNRPNPMGLAGHQPDVLLLARLAAAVGLATPHLRLSINGASAAPVGSVRLSWPGSTTPVAYPTQTLPATGPPLPMPVMFAEPVSLVADCPCRRRPSRRCTTRTRGTHCRPGCGGRAKRGRGDVRIGWRRAARRWLSRCSPSRASLTFPSSTCWPSTPRSVPVAAMP